MSTVSDSSTFPLPPAIYTYRNGITFCWRVDRKFRWCRWAEAAGKSAGRGGQTGLFVCKLVPKAARAPLTPQADLVVLRDPYKILTLTGGLHLLPTDFFNYYNCYSMCRCFIISNGYSCISYIWNVCVLISISSRACGCGGRGRRRVTVT